MEAQRKVVFSPATTKEISYELGFSEPAYFNRFFKLHTNKTPYQFRDDYPEVNRDSFMSDLLALIDQHVSVYRPAQFYADHFRITTGTLTRKIQQQANTTLLQLIQAKRIGQAQAWLKAGWSITDVAVELGFSEPNHFSAFFKNVTGQTPSGFRSSLPKVQCFDKIA